jgi:hypothetical protein
MMGSLKSPTEVEYLNLCLKLLDYTTSTYPAATKHTIRDKQTMEARTRKEGLSFLTKSLPKLGKALDEGLATLTFTCPNGFRTQKGRKTPAFMQAHFNAVFDCNGILREDASVEAVQHLRQVLFFVYKLEYPYSTEAEAQVIDAFVSTEEELEQLDLLESWSLLTRASAITAQILGDLNPKDVVPRHGPGAVATGERLEEKWIFSRLYEAIHSVYPYPQFYTAGGETEIADRVDWYFSMDRIPSGTAKVVLVPKDSRGPRLISSEPLEYQWIQQALGRKLVSFLESHPLTKGQINFTSQEVNRQLALESSKTLEFATLDLKDASDRVSLELVRDVFSRTPDLLRALEATRTTATRLPDGRVQHLRKFAPMGSALCFPVEAYTFWVVLVAGISEATKADFRQVGKTVYVYGDDIVVPRKHARKCIEILESVGLRVNVSKSCVDGPFRESCGMDAFKGVQVTPTRLKTPWSGHRSDGSALASYASLANQMALKGYSSLAARLWELLESVYGALPFGTSSSGFPCRVLRCAQTALSENLKRFKARWNRDYQRLEFFVLDVRPKRRALDLDGWPRLLRALVGAAGLEPSVVVLPRSTQIKRGWRAV